MCHSLRNVLWAISHLLSNSKLFQDRKYVSPFFGIFQILAPTWYCPYGRGKGSRLTPMVRMCNFWLGHVPCATQCYHSGHRETVCSNIHIEFYQITWHTDIMELVIIDWGRGVHRPHPQVPMCMILTPTTYLATTPCYLHCTLSIKGRKEISKCST